jgi:uncharacterized membrane protein YbhN (UPF0104 family)
VTIAGSAGAAAVLLALLIPRRDEFVTAVEIAPLSILVLAAGLQLLALLVRTEAWHACIRAAGGGVERRRVYRASGIGGLAALVNGQVAVAARVAALRRAAPHESPRIPALLAAELPILSIEAGLAAIASFTLVGPLGLPWWLPLVCLGAMVAVSGGLGALARKRQRGAWRGIAIMRTVKGRTGIVALILVAVFSQIARNWLVLHAIGVDVSVFDATALLIAMVTLSQLPLGPSVGAAASVLVLGPHGVALVAAAGVLLTATGTLGALCFAGWAVGDEFRGTAAQRWLRSRLAALSRRAPRTATSALVAALGEFDPRQLRTVEVAYFGGLTRAQIGRTLCVQVA